MASLDFAHIPSRRDHRGQATIKTAGRPQRSAVPDLRFEQSYLRSIQFYIFPDPPTPSAPLQPGHAFSGTGDAGHGEGTQLESEKATFVGRGKNVEAEPPYDMPLDIRWRGVAWVTARDQVMSPLIQGAVWGLLSIFVVPLSAQAGHSVRSFLGFSSTARGRRTEYAGWWRRWIQSFYPGAETSVMLSR